MKQSIRTAVALALVLASAALTGCGNDSTASTGAGNNTTAGVDEKSAAGHTTLISGVVYNGSQPLAGAAVQVYAAGLNTGTAPTQIGSTTTGSNGSFSLGSFGTTPAKGQLIYLVARGGHVGSLANNSDAVLMTVAGTWGSSNFVKSLHINELTTVASTATLQHYLTEENCTSIAGNTVKSGSCPAVAGGTALGPQAVAALANLVNVNTGAASTLLSSSASGSALNTTWLKLNFLASVLANCVDSTGGAAGDGTICGNLFYVATPAGDTLNAAFQLASNSTDNQAGAALFNQMPATVDYSPIPSTAPANWTVGGVPPVPGISSIAALNGAAIFTLSDSAKTATLYYTLDGSTPTTSSPQYLAPFLVSANSTLNVIAVGPAGIASPVSPAAVQAFTPNIPSGTLIWSDEFSNSSGVNAQPNPSIWTYDTGHGWGNQEQETYCGWNSNASPCSSASPNVYVGTDGYLHIIALQPSAGVYTSARLNSSGRFSMPYGRVEALIQMPEGQGLWPAFWLLGNNIATVGWPACGEMDIMEHIDAPSPDWIAGSLHMTNGNMSIDYRGVSGQTFSAANWHTYGMIWTPGSVKFYVDSPSNVYASYTPASFSSQTGAVWPFDSGNSAFLLLNMAVGGSWPGPANSTTVFPAQMLVDYVRVYAN